MRRKYVDLERSRAAKREFDQERCLIEENLNWKEVCQKRI